MSILGLHLETCDLAGLKDFYVNRLQLTFLEETAGGFAVQVGRTKLGFEKVDHDVQPIYRFTIGIPKQRFAGAVNRLSSRLDLLTHRGQTVFDLPARDTQAVYACDPVGNIVEFASYHADGAAASWGVTQIGMPVDDVNEAANYLLEQLELTPRSKMVASGSVLVGNSVFTFQFVKRGSRWFPSDKLAEVSQIITTVPSHINATIKVLEKPYYVHRAKV
jgi:catechol-2,3-dioxygenase